jgi:predicted nucleic acid-binding protein
LTTSPSRIEPIYVVDTNAMIWYLTTNKKLGRIAAKIFTAAERGETRLYTSAVVIAELYYANKKWKLFEDFAKIYSEIKSKPYFRLVPFRADDVLEFDKDIDVPEMHDRIITGLARRLNAPLLSSDPLILASKLVRMVW